MAAPDEYRSILSGETRPVDVVAIEQELTQLWKAAADTSGGRPVVRACVLNLVSYAPGDDVARHINEVVAQVSGRHPSRSIVIVAEPAVGSARLRASISAHCQIPPAGGRRVCSEQITLHASGSALDEVHGTVLPLLVPDLPVVLWWHHEPPLEGHLFRELLDSGERLVVDSADFAPERAVGTLADVLHLTGESDVALSDLNWSRLMQWRELIAQFFDALPARQYLDRLDRVSIEVAAILDREVGFTEALLLVGWLASRLGWTLEDGTRRTAGDGVAFDLRGAAGRVAVDLKRDPAHPGEGLRSLSLGAGGDAAFSVSRKAGEPCVVVTAEMPEGGGHSRAVHMTPPSVAALLCDQLDTSGRDAVFEEALSHAVRFVNGGR